MSGSCQYCRDCEIPRGVGGAQLVLLNGQWQPWPLVASRPSDVPVIHAEVCPICNRERFNEEEVPRLNAKIAAYTTTGRANG